MSRPIKDTVEYFPHYVNQGKTMFILEQKYGNDGYAFWFKLLELLASVEGHVYNCENDSDWLFLQAKTHLSEDTMRSIMDTLCSVGAIDKELWKEKKIWSQNLVNNLQPVYTNRRRKLPEKPVITSRNITRDELLHVETTPEQGSYDLSTMIMPQSKVKKSRVKKVKGDNGNVPIKSPYGSQNNVMLTYDELEGLRAKYPDDADDAIEFLSAYILEKDYQSKSHNMAIQRWVIDAVREKKKKSYGNGNRASTNGNSVIDRIMNS